MMQVDLSHLTHDVGMEESHVFYNMHDGWLIGLVVQKFCPNRDVLPQVIQETVSVH